MTKYIPVITRSYNRKIPVDDVFYLEQRQRKLVVVTEEGTFSSYQKIENVEAQLNDHFYHSLKKLIVNLDKIVEVRDRTVRFQNGVQLVLGRDSYVRTKQTYAAYLKNLI